MSDDIEQAPVEMDPSDPPECGRLLASNTIVDALRLIGPRLSCPCQGCTEAMWTGALFEVARAAAEALDPKFARGLLIAASHSVRLAAEGNPIVVATMIVPDGAAGEPRH